MEITDIRIFPVDEPKLKAFVSVTFDRSFIVSDIKIIDGNRGLFLSMPSKKRRNGTYKDIAHPLNSATRTMIEEAVIKAYEEEISKRAKEETSGVGTDIPGSEGGVETIPGEESSAADLEEPVLSPAAVPEEPTPSPAVVSEEPTPSPAVVSEEPTPSPAVVSEEPTPSPAVVPEEPTPSPAVVSEEPISSPLGEVFAPTLGGAAPVVDSPSDEPSETSENDGPSGSDEHTPSDDSSPEEPGL